MPYINRLICGAAMFMLLVVSAPDLWGQGWQWARGIGGPNNDNVTGIAVDASNNSYIVGTFERSIQIGTQTLSNGEHDGLFVAKYNNNGVVEWVADAVGQGGYSDLAIVTDMGGSVYIAGTFRKPVMFGTTTLVADGASDMFLAKWDKDGNFQWARRGGGNNLDVARGLAIDSSNNCYVTGSYRNIGVFGSHDVTSMGGYDVFVVKYNSEGTEQWVRSFGGENNDNGHGIATDGAGNVYVTGDFAGEAAFGPLYLQSVAAPPLTDIFVLKLAPDGIVKWAISSSSPFNEYAYGIAVERGGDAYVTGGFIGHIMFDTIVARGIGGIGMDMFIAKFDSSGAVLWAQCGGGLNEDVGRSVSIGGNGVCYVAGRYESRSGEALFGGSKLSERGGGDAFVAAYDRGGRFLWVQNCGSLSSDQATSIAAYRTGGGAVVCGIYRGTCAFGSLFIDGIGGNDVFLARIGNVVPGIATGTIAGDPFCSGAMMTVPFVVSGFNGLGFRDGNVFTAQLSDTAGSFAEPTVLGTMPGTTSGSFTMMIPSAIAPGERYRVRVVGSDPAVVGADNGRDLVLSEVVAPDIQADGQLMFCAGDSVVLDAGEGYRSYRWSDGGSGRTITVTRSGVYSVEVTNALGCAGVSPPVTVEVIPLPEKPTILMLGDRLEATPASRYQWIYEGEEIEGATGRTVIVGRAGRYAVQVFNDFGCAILSDPVDVQVAAVDAAAMAAGIAIYPQPTRGQFALELRVHAERAVTVVVRDFLGREVVRLQDRSAGALYRRLVDLRGEPSGVYFIDVESGGRRWVGEVIKH